MSYVQQIDHNIKLNLQLNMTLELRLRWIIYLITKPNLN